MSCNLIAHMIRLPAYCFLSQPSLFRPPSVELAGLAHGPYGSLAELCTQPGVAIKTNKQTNEIGSNSFLLFLQYCERVVRHCLLSVYDIIQQRRGRHVPRIYKYNDT